MPNQLGTQAALHELGVNSNTLTPYELDFLERNGYLVLEHTLNPNEVLALRQRISELTQEEGYSAGAVNQTPYQLRVNQKHQDLLSRLAACGYNLIFWLVRHLAWQVLFRYNPRLKQQLNAKSSRPCLPRKTVLEKIQAEIHAMLYAAAANEQGIVRLCDLVNKGEVFDVCFTHPRVLAAVNQVLGAEFKLSCLNYREIKPGFGLQPLHIDWINFECQVEDNDRYGCNIFWLLDDFTEYNGTTRVVPGTHKTTEQPKDVMNKPWESHPEEKLLLFPVGTVVVLNARIWHGSTLNQTDKPRKIIQSFFVRRDLVQQLHQRTYIRPQTVERLSPAAKVVLDVA